jgi:gluconate 2-dehydrogenase alpha chain/gluconate 2-dehydrogenase gamma chain
MAATFSRRAILLGLGAAGVAAGAPGATLAQNPFAAADPRPWFFLTNDEARFLAAACDVLIPADDYPSASQAGVVDFIDMQLAGPYGRGATLYLKGPFGEGTPEQGYQVPMPPAEMFRRGIAAIEADATLADADAEGRESFVRRLSEAEGNVADGIPAVTFFEELWLLTKQGFFGDPIYGGNKDYAGWEMIGFPGAHAYYTDFVDRNVPYPAPPKGVSHVPGTGTASAMTFPASTNTGDR